ncbi:DUF6893 family small protein [Arthrobacter hankyongi]
MKVVGTITTAVLIAAGLAAVYIGLRSLPDIQRYLKIRSM